MATINLLLNWLPTANDVGPFLDAFLLPFMRRRSMNIDESILHYIQVRIAMLFIILIQLNNQLLCTYLRICCTTLSTGGIQARPNGSTLFLLSSRTSGASRYSISLSRASCPSIYLNYDVGPSKGHPVSGLSGSCSVEFDHHQVS